MGLSRYLTSVRGILSGDIADVDFSKSVPESLLNRFRVRREDRGPSDSIIKRVCSSLIMEARGPVCLQ